jgi:hypothetical protein
MAFGSMGGKLGGKLGVAKPFKVGPAAPPRVPGGVKGPGLGVKGPGFMGAGARGPKDNPTGYTRPPAGFQRPPMQLTPPRVAPRNTAGGASMKDSNAQHFTNGSGFNVPGFGSS